MSFSYHSLMKIDTLRSFQVVLATGSFAGAAKQLNLTPSAVSLQMKQLEEYFGQLLFDRSARTARPTPFARASAASLAQSMALIDGLRNPRVLSATGILRLGVIASVEKSVLPRTLSLLQAEHPALAVRMSLDVSGALVDSVKAGRIDAAVAVRPQSGGSTRLHWYDLMRESFVLLAPPVTLGGTPDGTPAQLLERHPWIRYDTKLTGGRIAAAYVRRICRGPRPGFEVTSTDAIMAMVAEGLGVSVVPRPRAAMLASYAVRLIELGPHAPSRQIALVARSSDTEDRRVLAVAGALRRAAASASAAAA
ncbi:LysR family transcriptional regulator [Variovorax ginsengisoli]|uniref:DNA-binding transcriptional LysR family regulator n=1 Tax=Variovorax ginsengisoli TaxID=363844 RepID=A0ABT9SC63_9BURK|nr:LysR family transcriptional regulator [Variovorax ginsengisoli]MDP9901930.1 DNA-binding transcriptional LysR family regulator [Variovorax ginsengisoli]